MIDHQNGGSNDLRAAGDILLLGLVLLFAATHVGCVDSTRSAAEWPPSEWDRAEVILFNHMDPAPGIPLRVFDSTGWSPHIAERRPLHTPLAKRVIELVGKVRGDALVSKCPFPRHAIVFFRSGAPIASVSFSVNCGDLLLWPRYPLSPKSTLERNQSLESGPAEGMASWILDYSESEWTRLFEATGVSVTPWGLDRTKRIR